MVPSRNSLSRASACALGLALSLAFTGMTEAAPGLSARCQVPQSYTPTLDLERTEQLVDRSHAVRVLVLGPEVAGEGEAAPTLEQELERRLPDVDFTVFTAGASSGLAREGFELIRSEVSRVTPDLILWQVGAADALNASDLEAFQQSVEEAVHWVDTKGIDMVVIDPPFVPRVSHERIYWDYVGALQEIAKEEDVPLVRRYAAMKYWSAPQGGHPAPVPSAALRENCMTELVAGVIAEAAAR